MRPVIRPSAPVSAALLAVSLAGGCATSPYLGDAGPSQNYAEGSPLGLELSGRDRASLQSAFLAAMDGGEGERFDWQGGAGFGWVKAGARRIGGLKPDPQDRPAYPAGLELDQPLETELGLFALTRNANVRQGPSTDHKVLRMLTAGDAIVGVGKTVGAPWVLSEHDGAVVGYIHDSLMIKAPGTELELAGGPTRRPLACRDFEQRISVGGRSDRWEGVACLENGRWTLQAPPENAPVRLF